MSLGQNSLAAGAGVGVQNQQLAPGATTLTRKILVMGTFNPANAAGVPVAVPQLILSREDGRNRYGYGFMLDRLLSRVFDGTYGAVQVYAFPETETGASATGTFTVAGSPTAAGTLVCYVEDVAYSVPVTTTSTPTTIAAALAALINADPLTPVIAAPAVGVVTCTSKSKGIWGNFISLKVNANQALGELLPAGVTCAVVAMASGTGVPTVATDLTNGLGTGTGANRDFYTDVVHGYVQDATTLAAIGAYVGAGNAMVGLYDNMVGRPFRALTGDVVPAGAGLTALISTTGGYLTDRANGVLAIPGSLTHPSEAAAVAIAVMARINNSNPERNYKDQILPGVDPGNAAALAGNRWTDDYTNRDTAVKAGISPAVVKGGAVYLQNVVSFYRPANVAVASNGYREMVNISKLQNILYNARQYFEGPVWQGYTVVADVTKVTDPNARQYARDRESVIDGWVGLLTVFEQKAWLYSKDISIKALKQANSVVPRGGGDGYVVVFPMILSGVGNVLDNTINFDISLAILAAG